jgi:ANTAR domain-containing protein
MIDSTSLSQLCPEDLIGQAIAIIMNRFQLDAAQALEVLRRMSRNTRTQMCVIAEQVIEHNVPVEAVRGLEEDVLLGTLRVPQRRRVVTGRFDPLVAGHVPLSSCRQAAPDDNAGSA